MPPARRRRIPVGAREERATLVRVLHAAPIPAVLIGLLVLLIALPVLRNGFVDLDDRLYLGNRAVAAGLSGPGIVFALTSVTDLYWHPVAWLSHEADVALYVRNPTGHHLTSALLHALSAALLFLLLKKLGAATWSSAAGTLFWALHPLRVESFAWIAERKDLLCALFFLATLLAYLNYAARASRRGYLAWTGLGTLALMSKPLAVCLVPVLLLLDYWPLRRTDRTRWLLEKLPLISMTVLVVCLTIYGQRQSGSMAHLAGVLAWVRVENVAVFYMRYIGKILWPVNLACFYPYSAPPDAVPVIAAVSGLLGITVVIFQLRRRQPWLLVAWIWFVIAVFPNIGILQAGRQSIADRFTHLGAIGLSVGIACALSHWTGASALRERVGAGAAFAIVAALACLTVRQIAFWHDSVTLFEHAIGVEDSDYMQGDLATALMAERRYAEAESHLALAARRSPEVAEYHSNLANVLLRTGHLAQASTEAAVALRLAPDSIPAAETTALILFRQDDPAGTLRQFNHALELGAPKAPIGITLNDMGASLASRSRTREAEPLIRRALELNPRLVQGWRNLALLLIDEGRSGEAQTALQQAVVMTGRQAAYDGLLPEVFR
jgi:tetratricopeptide (TPR) repeat protein